MYADEVVVRVSISEPVGNDDLCCQSHDGVISKERCSSCGTRCKNTESGCRFIALGAKGGERSFDSTESEPVEFVVVRNLNVGGT